jgi:hypothetical protein
MIPTEMMNQLPPALQWAVLILVLIFGGAYGLKRGKIQFIRASVEQKQVEAQVDELDDVSDMTSRLRSHEIRLRELEAQMFGIAVHFSNLVLCDCCRHSNQHLMAKIAEMLARSTEKHDERKAP